MPVRRAPFEKVKDFLSDANVWNRIGLCALITGILWVGMFGWAPPFSYRVREAPDRDIYARVQFEYNDYEATEANARRARQNTLNFYVNDPQPLEQLRLALIESVFEIKEKSFEEMKGSEAWAKFGKPELVNSDDKESAELAETAETDFETFRKSLEKDEKLESLKKAIAAAFIEVDKHGLLVNLTHEIGQGSMTEIQVYPKGDPLAKRRALVSQVRIAEAGEVLHQRLIEEILKESAVIDNGNLVSDHLYNWIKPQLKTTLVRDDAASKKAANEAAKAVEIAKRVYEPGDLMEQFNGRELDRQGILAGVPLSGADIEFLRAEHEALVKSGQWYDRTLRSIFFFGLFAAVFAMLCQYLYYRDIYLLTDIRHFALLLGLMLVTLVTAWGDFRGYDRDCLSH